ncbi:MAG: hypothetical protein EOM12_10070 [Verrucomicrobiae bacterium]|nr:hypothetical protein [Verrucomicrobiae bacterium]
MKTKVIFSQTQHYEIDVFLEYDDNIECIRDYIEDITKNKKNLIASNIINGNNIIRVGANTNLVYLEDEDYIEILNDEDISKNIWSLNEDED